jgi:hypothetical protein
MLMLLLKIYLDSAEKAPTSALASPQLSLNVGELRLVRFEACRLEFGVFSAKSIY